MPLRRIEMELERMTWQAHSMIREVRDAVRREPEMRQPQGNAQKAKERKTA